MAVDTRRDDETRPGAGGGTEEERTPRRGIRGVLQRPAARMALIIAAIVIVVAGVFVWRYYSVRESTDDAQIDAYITPVGARVGGTVLQVNVDNNQVVKAGTILVQIDPKDYQVALDRARAELADAQAAYQAASTGVPIAQTTTASQQSTASAAVDRARAGLAAAAKQVDAARARLNAAQARLREAQANNAKVQKDLERMKQLVAKDEVSQQQYDAAVAAAPAAGSSVQSAEAAVAEAEQGVAVAESQRVQAEGALTAANAELSTARTGPQQVAVTQSREKSAQARVAQATAAVQQAELNLQYATVKAPSDGVVSKRAVDPGQTVQPGQPLMALVLLNDIWVTANFKETQLKDMRPGQRAEINVDAYGRTYRGHVDSIGAATGARFSLLPPENATGNYVKVVQRVPVKIVFEKGQDPNHLLRPGMSVVPTVITQ